MMRRKYQHTPGKKIHNFQSAVISLCPILQLRFSFVCLVLKCYIAFILLHVRNGNNHTHSIDMESTNNLVLSDIMGHFFDFLRG